MPILQRNTQEKIQTSQQKMLLKAIHKPMRKIDHLKGKDVSKIDKTDLSTNKS